MFGFEDASTVVFIRVRAQVMLSLSCHASVAEGRGVVGVGIDDVHPSRFASSGFATDAWEGEIING